MDPTIPTTPPEQPPVDPLAPKPPEKADPLGAMHPLVNNSGLDEAAVERRAAMFGAARMLEFDANQNYEDIMGSYDVQRDLVKASIEVMGDYDLRRQEQLKSLNTSLEAIANLQVQMPESYGIFQQVARDAVTRKAQTNAMFDAERAWAENLASLNDRNLTGLADINILGKEAPTLFDQQVKIQTIRAVLMGKIEEAKVEAEDRFFLWSFMDWVATAIPFAATWANTDNFNTELSSITDNILSGQRKANEADNWWTAMLRAKDDDELNLIMEQFVSGVNRNTDFLFGGNKLLKQGILEALQGYQSADTTNFFDALANAPLMGSVIYKGAFKIPFRMTNQLRAFGANKVAANRVVGAVDEVLAGRAQDMTKRTGTTVDELEEVLIPPAVNPAIPRTMGPGAHNEPLLLDPVHSEALAIMDDASRDLKDIFGDLIFTQRLDDVERAKMLADLTDRASKLGQVPKGKQSGTTRARTVVEADLVPQELPTGQYTYRFTAIIGRQVRSADENLWFASEREAGKQAKRLIVNHEIVPAPGGNGYAIKIWTPVDESGNTLAGSPIFNPFKDKQTGGAWSWLSKHAGGKITASEDLHGLAGLSESKRNLIVKKINDNILPAFYKISAPERMTLRHTLAAGERNSTWFSTRELETIYAANHGSGKDAARFVEAYNMAHKLNDIEYTLRNLEEYTTFSSQGYQMLQWGDQQAIGKVLRMQKTVPDDVIIKFGDDFQDMEVFVDTAGAESSFRAGRAFSRPRMSSAQLLDMQRNGYSLIRLAKPQRIPMGSGAAYTSHLLIKSTSVKTGPLPFDIIPYKAGGHRMYKGKYFPKMPVRRTQPWGEKILDKPFTPTVAISKADGDMWVQEANSYRLLYKELVEAKVPEDELLARLQDKMNTATMGHPKAEEFAGWMKEYGYDEAFELVFDRELPTAYRATGVSHLVDEDLSGINTFLDTQGQMYKSAKGDILKDINDWNKDGADVIDPFQIINRSLANVARLTSFTDFKLRGVNKWISTFGHALDIRDMPDANPMRIFLNGKFDVRTKEGRLVAQQANIQRDYIKRMLGWKSDADLAAEAAGRNLAEMVSGWTGPGKKGRAVHLAKDWWTETRPINALMGMAFDTTMGLWNPAQLPLQVQTAFGAMAIDATRGASAMGNMPAIMMYMRKGGGEADLDQFIRWGWHKMNGFDDPKSYKAMLRQLKQSGWMENMAATLKNEYGSNAALGNIGRGVEAVRNNGRIFVDKAEEFNRAIAWQIAWKRIEDMPQYKHLKVGTPAHIEKVRSLASTFAFNMDQAGSAWWQQNALAKLPTQFMGYTVRWHEMLWNKDFARVFGKGGTGISLKNEKIRFVLGQGTMYGFAGIPFVAGFTDAYERSTGQVADINTVQGMLARGMWDSLIYQGTGADVLFSERAGIGAYPTDIIGEMFGMSKYGEIAAADLALGATYQIGKDVVGAFGRMFYYTAAESGGELGQSLKEHSVVTVARHISTLNNIMKAYAVLEYGKYTNRNGQMIDKNLPDTYAFAALLGLNPAEMSRLTAEMGWLKDRKAQTTEWSKQVLIHRERVADAISRGDYVEADRIAADVNFLVRVLVPSELRADVLAEADKGEIMMGVVDSVAKRVNDEMSVDKFNEGLERGSAN